MPVRLWEKVQALSRDAGIREALPLSVRGGLAPVWEECLFCPIIRLRGEAYPRHWL